MISDSFPSFTVRRLQKLSTFNCLAFSNSEGRSNPLWGDETKCFYSTVNGNVEVLITEAKAGQLLSHKVTYIKDIVMTIAKFIYLGLL